MLQVGPLAIEETGCLARAGMTPSNEKKAKLIMKGPSNTVQVNCHGKIQSSGESSDQHQSTQHRQECHNHHRFEELTNGHDKVCGLRMLHYMSFRL